MLLGPFTNEGFGQSVTDELRCLHRYGRCRRQAVMWRTPSRAEQAKIDAHPIVERFGDTTIGIADVDGRRWILRDRDWFGWPDPPEYVLFVLENDEIWVAKDFGDWPEAWTRP